MGHGPDEVGRRSAPSLVVVAFSLVRWAQREFSAGRLAEILISGTISMGLSLSLGLFINRIVGEAESRAETIDELRATQARLAAAERDRGVHEERERMSREIHDTLAQGFTSVVALSRAAEAALARGDVATARDRLRLVERTASDNLDEARLIVAELTPGHLRSRTLAEALERLGAAVSSENGLRADVRVAGEPVPLGGSGEVVILRTAQEALANVRRHASAHRVDVTLAYDDPRAGGAHGHRRRSGLRRRRRAGGVRPRRRRGPGRGGRGSGAGDQPGRAAAPRCASRCRGDPAARRRRPPRRAGRHGGGARGGG